MQQKEYQVFGYRWVNLIVYTAVTFMAGAGFLAMAPMIDIMAHRWAIGFGVASLLMSVIGLFQLLLSIPAGWMSGKVGFKLPVAVGASLLALGFLLRSTADDYGRFMLYTIIAGLGWGMIWGPVGSLVASWFPGREVGLANSLWPVGFLAGQAFGSLTSIPFFTAFGWFNMWLIYGIIAGIMAVLAWILLRPRPPVPPEPRPPIKPARIGEGIKQTMGRTNLALQYTVFASVGSLAVAPAVVPPMLIAKGLAPPLAGVISGLALVGGTLGALLVPPFAFGRHRVRVTMLTCAFLAPIFFIALFYVPVTGGAMVAAIALSLLFGFAMVPVMAISMGVGQLQPGVNPGNAGILAGVFLTSIGLGSTVFPPLVGQIVDAAGVLGGAWMLVALAAISVVVLAIFVPEPRIPEGPPHGH
jgi:ACS family hexuronate transporter-like MFS transporter